MKIIPVRICDPVEDENGIHMEEYIEEWKYEDDQVRDNDFCTICGRSTYPDCTKGCRKREYALKFYAEHPQ